MLASLRISPLRFATKPHPQLQGGRSRPQNLMLFCNSLTIFNLCIARIGPRSSSLREVLVFFASDHHKQTPVKTAMPKIKRVVYSSDSSDEEIEVKKSKKERKTTSKPKKSDVKPEKTKKEKKSYTTKVDDSGPTQDASEIEFTAKLPTKNKKGQLVFDDWKDFHPNMTPKEVLKAGSFGGTYFRPIKSSITGQSYSGVWKELPKDWLEGLDIGKMVSSSTYRESVNTYKKKCGGSLEMWEESGWMHKQDPYGWFQWYCRFYQGRRSDDDERQVGRWLRCAGQKGRWKNNLIAKCARSGCAYDNTAISPVVRQTLQHWGYRLTLEDFQAEAKRFK